MTNQQQPNMFSKVDYFGSPTEGDLSFATDDCAKRAVMEVLARHSTSDENLFDTGSSNSTQSRASTKRKLESCENEQYEALKHAHVDAGLEPRRLPPSLDVSPHMRPIIGNNVDQNAVKTTAPVDAADEIPILSPIIDNNVDLNAEKTTTVVGDIPPSTEGTRTFTDNDVLSGRGGGTNVHPGNRRFRSLINSNRRAYLTARKNDKPAISKAIVKKIRECNGRFLKKDEKTGLWYEVGDDNAREKTSQALRQRAPEMRKIMFDAEQDSQKMQLQRQHQQLLAAMMAQQGVQVPPQLMGLMPQMTQMQQSSQVNPALNAAAQNMYRQLFMNKATSPMQPGSQAQLQAQVNQSLMAASGNRRRSINRYATHGA